MKNFIFPQVFQPVLGDNAFLPLLQHWQNTSRRIKTEVQLTQDNNQFLNKTTQLNLFLKSFTTNLSKRTYTQKQQEISERENYHKPRIKTLQDSIPNDTKNSKKEVKPNIRILGPKSTRINQSKNDAHITMQKNQLIDETKATAKQNEGNQKIHVVKEDNQSAKIVVIKKKNMKLKKNKGIFLKQKRMKTLDKQVSQNSIQRSYNNLQFGSKRLINTESKKKVAKKLSTSERRRAEITTIPPFNQNQKKQNIKISGLQKLSLVNHKTRPQNIPEEPSQTIFKSTESLVDKNDQNKKKMRTTFHALEVFQKQIKPKRSYTIWDLNKVVSLFQSESDQELIEKQIAPKKLKKKVHFGRTSIQLKTIEKQTKEIQNQNEEGGDIKSGRLRGVILRSKRHDSGAQIDSIQSIDSKKKRLFYNQSFQLKKGAKLKGEIENAYNQLNYLRMRLSLEKRNSQDSQTIKPQAQAVILSVERVMNEQQLQRIQKTRVNNMMIDFGVKMTRDSMLKQRALKDRVKNFM